MIDRYGLGPAENKAPQNAGQHKDRKPQRIDMRQGVDGQASHKTGRGISQLVRNPAVRHFMQDNAEQRGKKDHGHALHRCKDIKIHHGRLVSWALRTVEPLPQGRAITAFPYPRALSGPRRHAACAAPDPPWAEGPHPSSGEKRCRARPWRS